MKKNGKWKILLIALFMLPMVVFFPGCGNKDNSNNAMNTIIQNQTFTVHFYTGTGDYNNLTYKNIKYGSLIKEPTPPRRNGYRFVCWCKDITCTSPWTFSIDQVKAETTLYAKWEANQ